MRDIIRWVFDCHAINYAFWVSHLGRVFFTFAIKMANTFSRSGVTIFLILF